VALVFPFALNDFYYRYFPVLQVASHCGECATVFFAGILDLVSAGRSVPSALAKKYLPRAAFTFFFFQGGSSAGGPNCSPVLASLIFPDLPAILPQPYYT